MPPPLMMELVIEYLTQLDTHTHTARPAVTHTHTHNPVRPPLALQGHPPTSPQPRQAPLSPTGTPTHSPARSP